MKMRRIKISGGECEKVAVGEVFLKVLAKTTGSIVNVGSEASLRGSAASAASITLLLSDDGVNLSGVVLPSNVGVVGAVICD